MTCAVIKLKLASNFIATLIFLITLFLVLKRKRYIQSHVWLQLDGVDFWCRTPSHKTISVTIKLYFVVQWDSATGWTSHGGGGSGNTRSYRAQTSHDKSCKRREDNHRQTVSNRMDCFTEYSSMKVQTAKKWSERRRGSNIYCFRLFTSDGKVSR